LITARNLIKKGKRKFLLQIKKRRNSLGRLPVRHGQSIKKGAFNEHATRGKDREPSLKGGGTTGSQGRQTSMTNSRKGNYKGEARKRFQFHELSLGKKEP